MWVTVEQTTEILRPSRTPTLAAAGAIGGRLLVGATPDAVRLAGRWIAHSDSDEPPVISIDWLQGRHDLLEALDADGAASVHGVASCSGRHDPVDAVDVGS